MILVLLLLPRITRQYNHDTKGPIFITVGTAGQNLYNFTGKAPYIITQFLRHGFLNVNITDNGSMLDAHLLKLDLEKYRTDLVY